MGGAYVQVDIPTAGVYIVPTGHVSSTTQANAELLVSSGTATKLYARLTAAPGGSRVVTVSLLKRVGGTTTTVLSCTITDPATSCNSGSSTGTFADDEFMVVRAQVTTGTNLNNVNFAISFRYQAP